MEIPYPKKTSETKVEFDVWARNLWDWCDELLSDPQIVSKFRWHAERVFKFNIKTNIFERCYDETWRGNAWWKAQVSDLEISEP